MRSTRPSRWTGEPLRIPDPTDTRRRLGSALRRLREEGAASLAHHGLGRMRFWLQLQRYTLNPRRLWWRLDAVPIDRPLFLLGLPGVGATLVARVLYRHPRTVYASGNSRYWASVDEIHKCRHLVDLPESLRLRTAHYYNLNESVREHPVYGFQRSPMYAMDEFLPRYRRGAEDADAATSQAFRRVLRKIILAYAHDPGSARFVDMSHLYTIQVRYVARLLEGCDPRFLVIARNPYAVCQRTIEKDLSRMGTARELTREEKLACAVESWDNSYRLALACEAEVSMRVERYEDFIRCPEESARRICAFAELDFHPEQLPQPSDRFPLGSQSTDKWYPIRDDQNEAYLGRVEPDLVRALQQRSADLIERFGYERL